MEGLQWWWPQPEFGLELLWFERGSLAFFALEYLARLRTGPTDGSRPGSTVLRRLVHPLMLVDLIVLLAFAGSRWWQIDLRALRILRIPDLLARISRTLAGIDLAAGEVPFAEVQEARQQELAAARDALAGAAQQDLSELHEQLTKTTAAVRQVQQRWLLSARSNLELARQEVPATRSEVERLLTDLGEHLLARIGSIPPARRCRWHTKTRPGSMTT